MNLDALIDRDGHSEFGTGCRTWWISPATAARCHPGWAFLALRGEKIGWRRLRPAGAGQGRLRHDLGVAGRGAGRRRRLCILGRAPPAHGRDGAAAARHARRAPGAHRRHGHQWQDHHHHPHPPTAPRRRHRLRPGRHGAERRGRVEEEAVRTTPESPAFYRWLRRSVDAGDAASAVEVSSHALCLGRVHGALFKVGVFTNLTQDHLDYHGDPGSLLSRPNAASQPERAVPGERG